MRGKIKMFNPEGHYGFIIPVGNPNNEDVFFHEKDVFGDCDFRKGDPVEFNVINTSKGEHGINIIKGIRNAKKQVIKNNLLGFVFPLRLLIFFVVITCISIFLVVYFDTLPVECSSEDQVELTGLLRGFEKNGSCWDVKISNQSYLFNIFDSNYMQSMIGYNIMINCCYRHNTSYQVGYYDMCCAFITEVE